MVRRARWFGVGLLVGTLFFASVSSPRPQEAPEEPDSPVQGPIRPPDQEEPAPPQQGPPKPPPEGSEPLPPPPAGLQGPPRPEKPKPISPPRPRPKPRPRRPRSPQERYADLVKKMEALRPRGIYILIDTGTNRLYLMRDSCVIRSAICSTGSGRYLEDPGRRREWTFDTPKGEFKIKRKFREPVWIKPDWAFIEEGMPIPRDYDDRLAPEELGKYALDLGDGYLIHGTLYERALGLSVTHGCVRLGAKDLESVYREVKVGTSVFIF